MFRNVSMSTDYYNSGPVAGNDYRFFGCYRFFLATLVMVSHAVSLVPYSDSIMRLSLGNVGVFSFFILSGFVIVEALHKFYSGRPIGFLMNRLLKLYPMYLAALIVSAVILYVCKPSEFQTLSWRDLFGNAILVGEFLTITSFSFISVAWSVVVELQFYLVAALVFADFALGQLKATKRLAAVLALGFGVLGYAHVQYAGAYTRFYGALQFVPYFIVGAVLYYLTGGRIKSRLLASVMVAGAVLMSLHAYYSYLSRNPAIHVLASLSIFVVVLALFVLLSRTGQVRRFEKLDKYLGNLTYALFLIHPAVILLITEGVSFRGAPAFAMAVTLSILSAVLLYHTVEFPLMTVRDRIRGRPLYA